MLLRDDDKCFILLICFYCFIYVSLYGYRGVVVNDTVLGPTTWNYLHLLQL